MKNNVRCLFFFFWKFIEQMSGEGKIFLYNDALCPSMNKYSDDLKGINNLPGIRGILEKGSNAAAQKMLALLEV